MKSVVYDDSGDVDEGRGCEMLMSRFPAYDNRSRRRGVDSLEMRCDALTLSGLGSSFNPPATVEILLYCIARLVEYSSH